VNLHARAKVGHGQSRGMYRSPQSSKFGEICDFSPKGDSVYWSVHRGSTVLRHI